MTARTTTSDWLSTSAPLYRQAPQLRQLLSGQPEVEIVLPAAHLLVRVKYELHLLQHFLSVRVLDKLERLRKRRHILSSAAKHVSRSTIESPTEKKLKYPLCEEGTDAVVVVGSLHVRPLLFPLAY